MPGEGACPTTLIQEAPSTVRGVREEGLRGRGGSVQQPLPGEVEAGKELPDQGSLPFHILHTVHGCPALTAHPINSTGLHLNHKQVHGTRFWQPPSLSTALQTPFFSTLVSFKTIPPY